MISVTYQLGPWVREDVTQEDAPHGWRPGAPIRLHVIWEDEAHTVPLAVTDEDGCRAVLLRVSGDDE